MPTNYVLYPDENNYKWKGDPDFAVTGSGMSVPAGVEALFSYNGLVMNDLSVYDKYRVLAVDGLADPDVRDTREDRPGDDGEDAYGSYYSGRTIVLKIRVEAYGLAKLRDMEEALRTAFVGMQEKPLYFLTGDPNKDHFINCRKSASLTKDEDVANINFKHFRDWQITLRAADPRFYRAKKKYLTSLVNIADPELLHSGDFEWASAIAGWHLVSSSGSYSSGISSDWSSHGSDSLKLSSNHYGANEKVLLKTISGIQGGSFFTISGDFRQENLASTGFVFSSFRIVMVFLDSSDNLLSYYASPSRSQGGMNDEEWSTSLTGIAPVNATKIQCQFKINFSRDYNFWADMVSVRYTNNYATTQQVNIPNEGNFNMSPKIILSGTMVNPAIYNNNAPQGFDNIKFKSGVTIADDNFYVIDINKKTIVDKNGVNRIGQLDKTSGWLKLYPGANTLYMDDDTTYGSSSDAQFTVEWRDAWV